MVCLAAIALKEISEPIKATHTSEAIGAAAKNRDCFNKSERSMYA